jgi:cytochrome c biogenesis protein CcmG/thiol:disulfide interchange protein DsbE|tara:strand:- start:1248 stop:1760 length:513 start_codon:yes stop_codon:yes gene_type:complete
MTTRAFLAIFLLLLVSLFGFFITSLKNNDVQPIKTQEGKSLILDRELYTIEGIKVDKELLLSDKVILNVWASWCITCLVEHPFLKEISDLKNVPVIGISYKDQIVNAMNYLEKNGDPYDFSILDLDGDFSLKLGVTGAPETFLIIDGKIVVHRIGEVNINVWNDKFEKYF